MRSSNLQETAMRTSLRILLGLAFAALAAPAFAAGPQEIRTDPRVPPPAPRMQDGTAPPAGPSGPSAAPASAEAASTGAAKPVSAPRRALQAAQRGIDSTARIDRRTTVPRPKATPRQRPVAP
jgi:hypothetical protein